MPHVSAYLKAIEKALLAGNATEHTHRPAPKSLVESLDDKVTVTNEPKRSRCGAPDFIVTQWADVYDDVTHYRQTLAVLTEIMLLMSEIDAAVAAHGDWPLT